MSMEFTNFNDKEFYLVFFQIRFHISQWHLHVCHHMDCPQN